MLIKAREDGLYDELDLYLKFDWSTVLGNKYSNQPVDEYGVPKSIRFPDPVQDEEQEKEPRYPPKIEFRAVIKSMRNQFPPKKMHSHRTPSTMPPDD